MLKKEKEKKQLYFHSDGGILWFWWLQVRREKISERMKYLQDLVPGCNKVTGKAGMLDEIINYVQSLQRQVEVDKIKPRHMRCHFLAIIIIMIIPNLWDPFLCQFLSMKLAAINPSLDFDIDNYLLKEVITCDTNIYVCQVQSAYAINWKFLHTDISGLYSDNRGLINRHGWSLSIQYIDTRSFSFGSRNGRGSNGRHA